MRMTVRSIAILGALLCLAISSIGNASAQTDVGKALSEKLTARVAKLESACASKCAFELEEAATSVQTTADVLKDAVCVQSRDNRNVRKNSDGQGRIAACLLSNKSTASAGCVEAIQKVETMSSQ